MPSWVPLEWNRSRAAALAATLLLHLALALWLVSLRFAQPVTMPIVATPWWLPTLPTPPPPPMPEETLPQPDISIRLRPVPMPLPDAPVIAPAPDWYGEAAEVAGAIGDEPAYRQFGETTKAPPGRLKEEYPPSIHEKPLPRVGSAYRTPEGEQILWVSDHCFISLGTQSLTMQDFQKARNGVRRCIIYAGKREPRSDLFDHLKRPPKPLP
ncbi:MAG: hypothetical protein M3O07_04795 [Pseudomonadota bacterium]|nr:hypothetical protein [Pseudomonadota bacterium]